MRHYFVRFSWLPLCAIGVISFLVNSMAAAPPPPCNGELVNYAGPQILCGTSTPCADPVGGVCSGSGVWPEPIRTSCKSGGSASQRCEITLVVCTRSLYCATEPFNGKCPLDSSNPVLDPQGDPIVSWDDGAAMVSCVDQS